MSDPDLEEDDDGLGKVLRGIEGLSKLIEIVDGTYCVVQVFENGQWVDASQNHRNVLEKAHSLIVDGLQELLGIDDNGQRTRHPSVAKLSQEPERAAHRPPQRNIATAEQKGQMVTVYDERGNILFSRRGYVVGYTGNTVSIRGTTTELVTTFDARGKIIMSR